mmetsp:Transcript_26061/g.51121  ORF Transcript_26061/g.51121 Transcript_26061/m.51121 type:complete len:106 (-) Transcript_26061:1700-2017(-)
MRQVFEKVNPFLKTVSQPLVLSVKRISFSSRLLVPRQTRLKGVARMRTLIVTIGGRRQRSVGVKSKPLSPHKRKMLRNSDYCLLQEGESVGYLCLREARGGALLP